MFGKCERNKCTRIERIVSKQLDFVLYVDGNEGSLVDGDRVTNKKTNIED